MSFWAVGKVKPNQSKIARQNLSNQQFDYYHPELLEWKKTRQGMQKVLVPLFPNYIFIRIHENSRWASINSTHGLSGLLMSSGVPALVSDKVIEQLFAREQNGIIRLPKEARFKEGDTVIIQAGPFAGQQGLVERMSYKERERVLLALLSNKIKILVDEDVLEAA